MAKKSVTRSVRFGERDLPGFLDMLRYDQATVQSWNHDQERKSYSVILKSSPERTPGFEFTLGRWASFGIAVSDPIERSY